MNRAEPVRRRAHPGRFASALVRRGVYIIIVTPGRLNDARGAAVRMHQVNFVVMDEADRMLDMGFEPQIRKIISHVPRGAPRAPYTRRGRARCARWRASSSGGRTDADRHGRREADGEQGRERRELLVGSRGEASPPPRLADRHAPSRRSRVLIFSLDQAHVRRRGGSAARSRAERSPAMHGDASEQRERERRLDEFKRRRRSAIMVATDVAARGLDIKASGW